MNHCFVCQDKKKFSIKESELRNRVMQLRTLLRKFNEPGKSIKQVGLSLDRATVQLIQTDSNNPRLMCGRCPHVNQSLFNHQENEMKSLLKELLVIAEHLPNGERNRLYQQLIQLLRGDYRRTCQHIERLMRQKRKD